MRSYIVRDSQLEMISARADDVPYRQLRGIEYACKGAFDRLAAGVGLAVLSVPMCAIALAIKLSSPGPVLVGQTRVGKFGRPFTFYKFRSMRHDAETLRDRLEDRNDHDVPLIFKMRRDPRVTAVGRFLRRTSLDELPNLFNVLRGEMSIIGPRPPLAREVVHYERRHLQRLGTKPGLTGLWQVRGRSEIPFDEMVDLDLEYIENWSLWLDLGILLRTPRAVIGGRGAW